MLSDELLIVISCSVSSYKAYLLRNFIELDTKMFKVEKCGFFSTCKCMKSIHVGKFIFVRIKSYEFIIFISLNS